MANEEHLKIIKQGVEAWNNWREENPDVKPNLSEADLSEVSLREVDLSEVSLSWADLREADLFGADLFKADFFRADLSGADLSGANLNGTDLFRADLIGANLIGANLNEADLSEADLSEADLSWVSLRGANLFRANLFRVNLFRADLFRANLSEADLIGADLREADLREANLIGADVIGANLSDANLSDANLSWADLSWADLREADLSRTILIETNLTGTHLTGCSIYGISAWDLILEGATQTDLIITPLDEPAITVDNLEVAQFIYLLLNNEKVRDVIDTITSKVVLILGRFTDERKAVLDAIRDELRKRDYLPVLFDFDKPSSRDLTETVRTLAHLARFIIADLTEPRSIPQELQAIVPGLAVPVQPLLLEGSTGEYGMFQDLRKYDWVLEVHRYDSLEGLLASLGDRVIAPAEAKAKELAKR